MAKFINGFPQTYCVRCNFVPVVVPRLCRSWLEQQGCCNGTARELQGQLGTLHSLVWGAARLPAAHCPSLTPSGHAPIPSHVVKVGTVPAACRQEVSVWVWSRRPGRTGRGEAGGAGCSPQLHQCQGGCRAKYDTTPQIFREGACYFNILFCA